MLRRMLIGLGLALLAGVPASAQEDYGRPGFYVGVAGATSIFTKLDDQLGDVRQHCFPVRVPDPDGPIVPCTPEIQPGRIPVEASAVLGVNARAGYRFMPRLAAEAHLEYLPRSDLDAETFRFTTHITRLEALTLTADVKGYLLTGMVQPFGIVGFGWMKTSGEDVRKDPADSCRAGGEKNPDCKLPLEDAIDTDDSGFVGRFGGGVDVYVTRNVSLGIAASYVLPIASWDGDLDYNYISIDWGIQYRF